MNSENYIFNHDKISEQLKKIEIMNKEFIPYEQALELKELGFNERCFNHYSERDGESLLHLLSATPIKNESFITYKGCAAPLYQQAFRFFREKYGWIGGIRQLSHQSINGMLGEFTKDKDNSFMMFGKSYEEIELRCLKELIEATKNK